LNIGLCAPGIFPTFFGNPLRVLLQPFMKEEAQACNFWHWGTWSPSDTSISFFRLTHSPRFVFPGVSNRKLMARFLLFGGAAFESTPLPHFTLDSGLWVLSIGCFSSPVCRQQIFFDLVFDVPCPRQRRLSTRLKTLAALLPRQSFLPYGSLSCCL